MVRPPAWSSSVDGALLAHFGHARFGGIEQVWPRSFVQRVGVWRGKRPCRWWRVTCGYGLFGAEPSAGGEGGLVALGVRYGLGRDNACWRVRTMKLAMRCLASSDR